MVSENVASMILETARVKLLLQRARNKHSVEEEEEEEEKERKKEEEEEEEEEEE